LDAVIGSLLVALLDTGMLVYRSIEQNIDICDRWTDIAYTTLG